MAQRTIPALLAAAVLALPMAAQAQQQKAPSRGWETVSKSWALHAPGGAPIPCVKTGRWGDADPRSRTEKDNMATFRCGGVTVTRGFNPAVTSRPGWALSGKLPVRWVVTDKNGKTFAATTPVYGRDHELIDPIGSEIVRFSTVLNINGQQIQLIETVKGRFVPEPQPVFR